MLTGIKFSWIFMDSKRVHLPKLNSVPVQAVIYQGDKDGHSVLEAEVLVQIVSLC